MFTLQKSSGLDTISWVSKQMVKNEKLEKEGEMVWSKFVNISYRISRLKS